jgi:hypothetical protein
MRSFAQSLLLPVAAGLIAVLPFAVLEWINTDGFSTVGIPLALFGLLWILASTFTSMLAHAIRILRVGSFTARHAGGFAVLATFIMLIATVWTGIVLDQMPCFMGVPNCD